MARFALEVRVPAAVRSKTIPQSHITGERGVAMVKERIHAMGFLFHTTGQTEAGIDGFIEIRDPATGRVAGRIVAVQIKATDAGQYTRESDEGFEYLCDAEDVQYWQQGNLPLIVVLVRISDGSIYWKPAPSHGDPGDRETRRLRISKASDRFDQGAGDAIADLTVDQTRPGVWLPASRQQDTLLFNAVKVALPPAIWVASTTHRHGRDALKALLDLTDRPPYDWVARGGRLITFSDIGDSALRHVVDQGSIEELDTEEFALHEDEEEQNLFIELLNRTLRAQVEPTLAWSRAQKLYYFPADGAKIDRFYRYTSMKNEARRAVVKAFRRQDGAVSFVRHSAFHPRFFREFDDWYLSVKPNYMFTWDGARPDRFAGSRLSKIKRLENNAAVRGQFLMWRSLLMGLGQEPAQRSLLDPEGPAALLRFEPLDIMSLPVSVSDDLWRSRDANAPDDDEEELPL